MNIILVIGCAACVKDDLKKVPLYHDIVATNQMILDYPKPLTAGVTLHPERAAQYAQRGTYMVSWELADGVTEVWDDLTFRHGSSGLYAVGYALRVMRASLVVLAGVPLDDTPHYYDSGGLEPYLFAYREAWQDALPQLRGRVISMSGWTRHLLES